MKKKILSIFLATVMAIMAMAVPAIGTEAEYVSLDRTGWMAEDSSHYSDREAGRMLDGSEELDGNHHWSNEKGTAGEYFIIDMGEENTITKTVMAAADNLTVNYTVEVSADKSVWNPVGTFASSTMPWTAEFAETTARYIKITLTEDLGTWWNVIEFYAYGVAKTEENIIDKAGWAISANKAYGSRPAEKMIDGNTLFNTFWSDTPNFWSNGDLQAVGDYIKINMGTKYSVNKFMMVAGQGGYPTEFEVLVSTNDVDYESVGTFAGKAGKCYAEFEAKEAKYIKVSVVTPGSGWWNVSEVYAYGTYVGENVAYNTIPSQSFIGKAFASYIYDDVKEPSLFDGDLEGKEKTGRWSSGALQEAGQWVTVNLADTYKLNAIEMVNGAWSAGGAAKKFNVYVSENTEDFDALYGGATAPDLTKWTLVKENIEGYAGGKIEFEETPAHAVLIVLQAADSTTWWTFTEFVAYTSDEVSSPDYSTGAIEKTSWQGAATDYGYGVPENLFDGNVTTVWQESSPSVGDYFMLDLGKTYSLTEIKLLNDYFRNYHTPDTFDVYTSVSNAVWENPNASAWTLSKADVSAVANPISIKLDSVVARYVMVKIKTVTNGWWMLGEVYAYGTETSVYTNNIPSISFMAEASSEAEGTDVYNIFVDEGYWATEANGTNGDYVTVDLAKTYNINAVTITTDSSENMPSAVKILALSNNSTWSEIGAISNPVNGMTYEVTATDARYIKIVNTSDMATSWRIDNLKIGSTVAVETVDYSKNATIRSGWKVTASANADTASNAIDGKDAVWTTGENQQTGDWFMIDMGKIATIDSLAFVGKVTDNKYLPGTMEIYTSLSADVWNNVESAEWGDVVATAEGANPLSIDMNDTKARYILVILSEANSSRPWAIGEIYAHTAAASLELTTGEIDKTNWVASAYQSFSGRGPEKMIDGNATWTDAALYHWSNGDINTTNDWIMFDMGETRLINKTMMVVEAHGVPLVYSVQVSIDNEKWFEAGQFNSYGGACFAEFDAVEARYIKLQTVVPGTSWWNVAEFYAYTPMVVDEFALYSGETEVKNLSAFTGTMQAKANIHVTSDNVGFTAELVCAQYAGDKVLSITKTDTTNLVSGENPMEFAVTAESGVTKVKLFLWDSLSGLNPIADCIAITE